MGSGGTEFDGSDGYSAARLNQKTTFVGTTAQIAALGTTYPGQLAFDTDQDILFVRNAANNAWIEPQVVESSELNSTPVTDNADFTVTAGHRYYAFFTFPTTEKLYWITGIEWKNGASVAGTVVAGVDLIDADPPVETDTVLISVTAEENQSGTSAVQRAALTQGFPVRGGSIVGIWVHCSSGSATLREQTGLGSQNQQKATSYTDTPGNVDVTSAWTTATARKYLKLYYVGYT